MFSSQTSSFDKYYEVFAGHLFEVSDFIPKCQREINSLKSSIKDSKKKFNSEILDSIESGQIKNELKIFNDTLNFFKKKIYDLEKRNEKKEWNTMMTMVERNIPKELDELGVFRHMVYTCDSIMSDFHEKSYKMNDEIRKLKKDSEFIFHKLKSDMSRFEELAQKRFLQIHEDLSSHYSEFEDETNSKLEGIESEFSRQKAYISKTNFKLEKLQENPFLKIGAGLKKFFNYVYEKILEFNPLSKIRRVFKKIFGGEGLVFKTIKGKFDFLNK